MIHSFFHSCYFLFNFIFLSEAAHYFSLCSYLTISIKKDSIQPRIRWHNGTIHDIQSRIIEYLKVQINHAFLIIAAKWDSAHKMCGCGKVKQAICESCLRNAIDFFRERLYHMISNRNLLWNGMIGIRPEHQSFAEEGK